MGATAACWLPRGFPAGLGPGQLSLGCQQVLVQGPGESGRLADWAQALEDWVQV